MHRQPKDPAASALLEQAAAHGVNVATVAELRRYGARCAPFVDALVGAVRDTTSPQLLEDLAAVLAAPWARDAAFQPLAERYRSAPNSPPSLKAALAQALGVLADERSTAALMEFAAARKHGNSRAELVSALGRLNGDGVLELLVDLLRDPGVGGHALSALRVYVERTRDSIDPLLVKPFHSDGRAWVRRDAKELLHLLDTLP